MKYAHEEYVDILKRYNIVYENKAYEMILSFQADEKERPLRDIDPRDNDKLHINIVSKEPDAYPSISVSIRKRGDGKRPYAKAYRIFDKRLYFEEMDEATGEWAEARRAIVEASQIIEELFPGYYIVDAAN